MKRCKIISIMFIISILLSALIFSNVTANTATQKTGDVNGDGKIDIVDATTITKSIVQNLTGSEKFNKNYADFNRDGEVSVIDATLVQEYIVDMIVDYNGCLFSITNNEASLYLYYGKSAYPTIPGIISNYPVNKISRYAFNNSSVITVTLPYQVQKIDDNAFYNCPKLTTIYTKNPNLKWGNSFVNCPKLQSIKFINS